MFNTKNRSDPDKEPKDLCRLLSLINTPASKQQLPSLSYTLSHPIHSLQWPLQQPKSGAFQHQSTEACALEEFSRKYQNCRTFSQCSQQKYFEEIFSSLIKKRLCCAEWTNRAPPENLLRVLVCLRILLRDTSFQKYIFKLDGIMTLADYLQKATDSYLSCDAKPFVADILKEMTNIFQKLSANGEQHECLISHGIHRSLVILLNASDVVILHCALHALKNLVQSHRPCQVIGELNSVELLIRIIQEYDIESKKLAASLLRLLCDDSQSRTLVKLYKGIPTLLSQLHTDDVNLQWHVVWCLVQLGEDPDASHEIKQMGGIPLFLSLLQDHSFLSECTDVTLTRKLSLSIEECDDTLEKRCSLKCACCAALTELVLDDTNAHQIVQANGIYILGQLILPKHCKGREYKGLENLQKSAFRALRFLFSVERNRRLFKRLFPSEMYVMFIDVGHYNKDLSHYQPLVDLMNRLPQETIENIQISVQATNLNKAPSQYIGDYAVFELLGSGAFGSVYKVKKKTAEQSFLAMKEINLQNPAFGKNEKERSKSLGEIVSEITIIKEQLRHQNIVRYYKTFEIGDRLYIVMELIEGAPLGEHFSSLKEKKRKFAEKRIWNIFIQMVLALRYLHKDKNIVHRDLTPNNIMLGENDRVTITDFGLAKQKRSDHSQMISVVGTILYSCPEVVKHEPYEEKADIWALGCILYQMGTLQPPFFSTNMLTLAKKIVEGDYEPIPEDEYSQKLIQTVKRCLTVAPNDRPDILQLIREDVDVLLLHIDSLQVQENSLQKRLDRERRRTQKHFFEAVRNMQNYQRLFVASQEHCDKIFLSSDGADCSTKGDELSDSMFLDSGISSETKSKYQSHSSTTHEDAEELESNDQVLADVWTSDEENYISSGSNSREGSAGSTHSRQDGSHHPSRKVSVSPTVKTGDMKENKDPSQLSLHIPNPAKCSHDSGIGSGDPSPKTGTTTETTFGILKLGEDLCQTRNFYRSQSSPAVNLLPNSARKPIWRPSSSTAATLTISPRRVRQINDPILQMLHQLHKIIYITQLPPTLKPNRKRRVIEQFKRALFAPQSTSVNLKSELKKLLNGSPDIIDLGVGLGDSIRDGPNSLIFTNSYQFGNDRLLNSSYDPDFEVGISYEQMQSQIENTLVESGYYNMPAHRDPRQRLPLKSGVSQTTAGNSTISYSS